MEYLERAERREALRSVHKLRASLYNIAEKDLSKVCRIQEYGVPCGMLPAVDYNDVDGVHFTHDGFCGEKHMLQFSNFKKEGLTPVDTVLQRTVDHWREKAINELKAQLAKLCDDFGVDAVRGAVVSLDSSSFYFNM